MAAPSKESNQKYRRSPKGVLMRAYHFASRRIKECRGLYEGMSICTREEFYAAFKKDPRFLHLHELWTKSGYQKGQRPTPDRLDTSKGYLVGNIKWETYNVNTLRALPNVKRVIHDPEYPDCPF